MLVVTWTTGSESHRYNSDTILALWFSSMIIPSRRYDHVAPFIGTIMAIVSSWVELNIVSLSLYRRSYLYRREISAYITHNSTYFDHFFQDFKSIAYKGLRHKSAYLTIWGSASVTKSSVQMCRKSHRSSWSTMPTEDMLSESRRNGVVRVNTIVSLVNGLSQRHGSVGSTSLLYGIPA